MGGLGRHIVGLIPNYLPEIWQHYILPVTAKMDQEMNSLADSTFVRRRPRPTQLSQGSPSQDRPPGPFSLPSQNELFGGAAISQEGS